MASIRTFIAVPASAPVRQHAIQLSRTLGRGMDSIKWVAEENLHWTLQFLGDVEETLLANVCHMVGKALSGTVPFDIEVVGAGAYPARHRPRTLWLGVAAGRESMIELQNTVASSLESLGFRREQRPYAPHLTIGRVRGGQRAVEPLIERLADYADFHAGAMCIDAVTVFASELNPGGPTYHVLSKVTL
ncbi:MAG: RNA 2',3'-cyclic phosphodiesterase [Pirellulales bacterium]|nr:RNA 2',3'-cyclic phosphodiesterase [Pirellulales bacterium]